MKNIVEVQLDRSEVESFVAFLRMRRSDAVTQKSQAEKEIASCDANIKRLEAVLSEREITITKNGRVKRGESEKRVLDFLQGNNGTGLSIRQITEATGTKYGTVHRLMKVFRKDGLVKKTAAGWRLER